MPGVLNKFMVRMLLRRQARLGRVLTKSDFNLICSQILNMDKDSSRKFMDELQTEGRIEIHKARGNGNFSVAIRNDNALLPKAGH